MLIKNEKKLYTFHEPNITVSFISIFFYVIRKIWIFK